ncbi:hypothetical protein CsSME_00030515 [Camellia sinensis var. sinensis]
MKWWGGGLQDAIHLNPFMDLDEFNQEDEAAVLQEAKEAEKMIVEAYAALLLAFLSTESKIIRDAIAKCLPGYKLAILVPVLERFVVCISVVMRRIIVGISFVAKHDLARDPFNCA